jgi:hypothetical protein
MKARTHHTVAMAAAVALAAGCASVGYFKDSTAGKVATVEVVMNEAPESFAIYRNGVDCSGGLDILSRETTASIVAGTGRPLIVEAEKELAMYLDGRQRSPLKYCEVRASFFPEPDGRYRVRVSKTASGCSISVSRLVDASREVPEPSFKRRVAQPGVTSTQCVPL